MRALLLLSLSAVVSSLLSSPSRACEPTVPLRDTVFPFEGRSVPRNTTLGGIAVDDTVYGRLVGEDGVVRRVVWGDDNDAQFLQAATTTITVRGNLDPADMVHGPFDRHSVAVLAFDTLGQTVDVRIHFSKIADGSWEYTLSVDGAAQTGGTPGVLTVIGSGRLYFNNDGQLVDFVPLTDNFLPTGATEPQWLSVDLGSPLLAGGDGGGMTQFARANSTSFVGQDGYGPFDELLAGRQVLTLLSTDDDGIGGERPSREIAFEVDDVLDTDAALVSVSITRRSGGDTPERQEDPCVSTPSPTSFATIAIESGGEDAAFIELQSGERLRLRNGAVEVNEDNRNLSGLFVVDFAGNASVPRVVAPRTGEPLEPEPEPEPEQPAPEPEPQPAPEPALEAPAEPAGCHSTNGSSASGLVVFAAILRRRRR